MCSTDYSVEPPALVTYGYTTENAPDRRGLAMCVWEGSSYKPILYIQRVRPLAWHRRPKVVRGNPVISHVQYTYVATEHLKEEGARNVVIVLPLSITI